MDAATEEAWRRLARSLEANRVHSAYLLAGPGDAPRAAALRFARALVCEAPREGLPCEACHSCRRSAPGDEPIPLDGSGKKGPLLRHVGDHPDLLWVERGEEDTRVRIGQIRAVQSAFWLQGTEGSRRAAVIADAEWLNQEAQNALLRILEEPPPRTTLVLVAASSTGLLATLRSRCQRVAFPPLRAPSPSSPQASEPVRAIAGRLEGLGRMSVPALLDWAEEFRGPRAVTAPAVTELLVVASAWLHERVCRDVFAGRIAARPQLEAHRTLQQCRRSLARHNANPQMVAERALLALQEASTP